MKHWLNRTNFLAIALYPLSCIYALLNQAYRLCYYLGLKKKHYFPVPIIIVGNISVGGTGKTPCVRALAQLLKNNGKNPGIVMRGYGGQSSSYPLIVTEKSKFNVVGDEALMLAKMTDIPIVISPDRPQAVSLLLQRFNCDVVISDDGLGHLALDRDIEIIMIDGNRFLSNQWLLPAGPLRESVSRLKSVDCLLINSRQSNQTIKTNTPSFDVSIEPESFISIRDKHSKKNLKTRQLHALAGIGNPDRFFGLLRSMGFDVLSYPFPDHHRFTKEDIDIDGADIIIMTEKDAVKCASFADHRHWYLKANMIFSSEFEEFILRKLESIQ